MPLPSAMKLLPPGGIAAATCHRLWPKNAAASLSFALSAVQQQRHQSMRTLVTSSAATRSAMLFVASSASEYSSSSFNSASMFSSMTPAAATPITTAVTTNLDDEKVFRSHSSFKRRHLGPTEKDIEQMLKIMNVESLEEMTSKAIPKSILISEPLKIREPLDEIEMIRDLQQIAKQNEVWRSYIGTGFHNCYMPNVIQRCMFESPDWYTAYTPYQPEISQGRLESLLNYQTMIANLTGMEIANASLLDEATAAAEAMTFAVRKTKRNKFIIDSNCHPQSIDVIMTRAKLLDIEIIVQNVFSDEGVDLSGNDISGVLVQYPDTNGTICTKLPELIQSAKEHKTMSIVSTDLLSLLILKSPGELGADVVIGSSQRFGIPIGYGGPHAAFMACQKNDIRLMPGRIIGVSKDADGEPAFRLTLQTREQHIKRDKATSNICTAQALLANMAAMYAIYHGPAGLRQMSERVHRYTLALVDVALRSGFQVTNRGPIFDTLKIRCSSSDQQEKMRRLAESRKINLRYFPDSLHVGISMDETVNLDDLGDLCQILHNTSSKEPNSDMTAAMTYNRKLLVDNVAFNLEISEDDPISAYSILNSESLLRSPDGILSHPVFNKYHSETELMRYMHDLERRDLSLTQSMIPLGSCTMKLNSATELAACSWPEFNAIHPHAPANQSRGYAHLFDQLEQQLAEITGYDAVCLAPNSGAQGEYAGLCCIRAYLNSIGQGHRDICLIPFSAHGTNPASAQLAGLTVKGVKLVQEKKTTDNGTAMEIGSIDLEHLAEQIDKYRDKLAALMITYPSTTGIFEAHVQRVCEMVHEAGGQVYLDGANMNAQVGLCKPGHYGSDVSHLNLHKTFCIPHGGGGPGVGPIGVRAHLAPFLPSHRPDTHPDTFGQVTSAPSGSAMLLPIPYAYIRMMGGSGLRRASQIAILNANYMMRRLKDYYPIRYVNANGFCAHEFILDCAPFMQSAGIQVNDVAKRLIDYGFHAPTMSWPVSTGLMVEPTESENLVECDRLCDSLIQIREEIRDIEKGLLDRKNNPLKNAPHTLKQMAFNETWNRSYTRQMAAFPGAWQRQSLFGLRGGSSAVGKFWPSVARVDDYFGDRNIQCDCPSVEDFVE